MPRELLTDSQLWCSIAMDDAGAFSVLFDRYWSKLYATAYRYLKDEELCEEIVHDVFLSIWNNRKTLSIESFQNYLISSARYQVYKKQKAIKKSPLSLVADYPEDNVTTCNNNGAEKLVTLDMQYEIDECLKQLPKRCLEIFMLSRYDHLSNDEIAQRLHISKRSVENQITNALKLLRVAMKDIAVMTLIELVLKH